MKILVTGGAGFIGSALVRHLIRNTAHHVVNVDKLTYAGDLRALENSVDSARYSFEQKDVCEAGDIAKVLETHQPNAVIHLAAESHVDRSIDAPADFIRTNVLGTYSLLEASLRYYNGLDAERARSFRFHHVSTDEVFGSLGDTGAFTEETRYDPNSPYSASKAASDHLVRAWHRTFKLPIVLTNCTNNYGPYQFPEKLIPLMTLNAIEGRQLPLYGKGDQVRDWLFVDDHVRALMLVLERGHVGETYNIGGSSERTNLAVANAICAILEELRPAHAHGGGRYEDLVTFVQDRPGHDHRYAIDTSKIKRELGWTPRESFESGLRLTVEWYLTHSDWLHSTQRSGYGRERLGLPTAPR